MKVFSALVAVLPLVSAAAFEPREVTTIEKRQTRGCQIVGKDDVNCHYCDREDCAVVTVLNATKWYNFDCACPNGQTVKDGVSAWDHEVDLWCWVFAEATDDNCPTTGAKALPECDFCGK
ncbi:hypothetical protein V8E51_016395 [Hyaloscypha variabilis]